ncbi:MAG: NAD(P)/FAD-dependent oxidoreductase [Lentisphaerae bacterium]|nr:NAD(P)/FAD-dependent oxidoreductase [Lentisphaerota bacterium]
MESDVIIVGGGPAGSTCALMLRKLGVQSIILDKAEFPRVKLCAGWITPRVAHRLELGKYPHGFLTFEKFHILFRGIRINLRTTQYSVRRVEFDKWLLDRANVPVYRHQVTNIARDGNTYVIDNKYRCRFLVGAGGTYCPVYRSLFKQQNPRAVEERISAMEEEFEFSGRDGDCRLWFGENGLPGYSWYVPKSDGVLNVGIGGLSERMKTRGRNILDHWRLLVEKLENERLVSDHKFGHTGYNYYRRKRVENIWRDNACIIGDAAGLATRDMGEGIGPAVESGILAAKAIKEGRQPVFSKISRYSLPWMVLAGMGIYRRF